MNSVNRSESVMSTAYSTRSMDQDGNKSKQFWGLKLRLRQRVAMDPVERSFHLTKAVMGPFFDIKVDNEYIELCINTSDDAENDVAICRFTTTTKSVEEAVGLTFVKGSKLTLSTGGLVATCRDKDTLRIDLIGYYLEDDDVTLSQSALESEDTVLQSEEAAGLQSEESVGLIVSKIEHLLKDMKKAIVSEVKGEIRKMTTVKRESDVCSTCSDGDVVRTLQQEVHQLRQDFKKSQNEVKTLQKRITKLEEKTKT